MLIDIRIKSELPRHRKFKRLKRIIGASAMEHLITFWCNIAEQIPNGTLSGWSNEDIAEAANWNEEADCFIDAMVDSGFIDREGNQLIIHDWADHQPWVVGAKERSERAKIAGKASAKARLKKYGTTQPPNDSRTGSSKTVLNSTRTPSPTPSPTPNSSKRRWDEILPQNQVDEIIALCKQIETLPSKKNIRPFEPYKWIQKASNHNAHPLAIIKTLEALTKYYSTVKNPNGYVERVFKIENQNLHEADSLKEHEQHKQEKPPSKIKQLTEGIG